MEMMSFWNKVNDHEPSCLAEDTCLIASAASKSDVRRNYGQPADERMFPTMSLVRCETTGKSSNLQALYPSSIYSSPSRMETCGKASSCPIFIT